MPQAIESTQERERDEYRHEERDPHPARKGPCGRVRRFRRQVMIQGLHNVWHQTLNDDEVATHVVSSVSPRGAGGSADLIDTPKHLIAIAASKKMAARGNVRCATAKNDDLRCGVCRAQSERRYSPNAATEPENRQVSIPGMIPADARACTLSAFWQCRRHE
jgi:hypothetical protein